MSYDFSKEKTKAILHEIQELDVVKNGQYDDDGVFNLVLKIGGSFPNIEVRVHTPVLSVPEIILTNAKSFDQLPHVEPNGVICYQDKEGIIIDRQRPSSVIIDCISKAAGVLEAGINGDNTIDFCNEWMAVWAQLGGTVVYSLISKKPTKISVEELVEVTRPHGVAHFLIDNQRTLEKFLNDSDLSHTKSKSVIVIPLKNEPAPIPLQWPTVGREARDFVLKHLDPYLRRALKKASKKQWKYRVNDQVEIFLTFPHGNDNYSIFGIGFEKCKKHPLLGAHNTTPVSAFQMLRRDHFFYWSVAAVIVH